MSTVAYVQTATLCAPPRRPPASKLWFVEDRLRLILVESYWKSPRCPPWPGNLSWSYLSCHEDAFDVPLAKRIKLDRAGGNLCRSFVRKQLEFSVGLLSVCSNGRLHLLITFPAQLKMVNLLDGELIRACGWHIQLCVRWALRSGCVADVGWLHICECQWLNNW